MPMPSQQELLPLSARFASATTSQTLQDFKDEMSRTIATYHGYAVEKRKLEWGMSDATTYGGIAAVAGALADRTGLLNTGAGIAALGMINSSRYNFGQQSNIYINAAKGLSCIYAKVAPVPQSILDEAVLSDDTNAASIAKGAIAQMVTVADTIRTNANNELLGIKPTTLTRDELLVMVNSYRPAATANSAPIPGESPLIQQRRIAGETIKTLLAEVSACAKS